MSGAEILSSSVRADPSLAEALPQHIMVAGATGETGRLLVAHLSASGVGHITAIVRNPASAVAAELGSLRGVLLVQCGDVADADALASAVDTAVAQLGVPHSFVSCMGIPRNTSKTGVPPGETYTLASTNLIQAAKRIGVKRYVHMSSGFCTRPTAVRTVLMNSIRGMTMAYQATIEDIVRTEVASAPGLDYVILRPGGLDYGGPGDGFQITQGDTITGGPVRRSRVAEVLAQTLNSAFLPRRHGEEVKGVSLEVAGDKKGDSKLAGKTNRALSTQRWETLLGSLRPDPVWESLASPSKINHLAVHRAAVRRFKSGCCVCCLVVVGAIVVGTLANRGMFSPST